LAHASGNPCSKLSFASFQNLEQSAIPLNSSSSLLGSKSKFSGALRRSYGYTEAAHGSSKEHKKAAKAAKRKQTLKHLPKKTRRALGQQAAKARQSRN
jgi:hypothetical protein